MASQAAMQMGGQMGNMGGQMGNMANMGNQMTPQQQQQHQAALMQAHILRQNGNQIQNTNQIAQNYAAQLASMSQRPGGMPVNANMNMNGGPGMNMQNMQYQANFQANQAHHAQQAVQHAAQAQAQAAAQNNPLRQQMVHAIRTVRSIPLNDHWSLLTSP